MSPPNFDPENYKYSDSSNAEDDFDPENFKSSSSKPMVNTFLGRMPAPEEFTKKIESPEFVDQLIGRSLGATTNITPLTALGKLVKRTASMLPIAAATKDLSPLEKKFSEAKDLAESATMQDKAAQGQAAVMGQSRNPNTLQSKILENQNKLNKLHSDIADTPPMTSQELQLPEENIQQSENNLNQLQQHHEQAQQLAQDTDRTIGEHLNQGAQHDVRAARQIEETQDNIRQGIGHGYDQLEQTLRGRNITVNNSERISQLNRQLMGMIRANQADSPAAQRVLGELRRLEGQDTINAADYLRAYRSTRQFAREARQNAYRPGMNAEERHQWTQRYNELDDQVEEMGNTLEQGIGSQDYQRLHDLNNAWRTQVVPLQRNTIFQNIRTRSQMPDNIVKALRGDEPGNMLMRNIIQNDPQIVRNVVGQRYAIRPGEIHEPNETMQDYLNHMPELNQLLRQREHANTVVSQSEETLGNAQRAHQELVRESNRRTGDLNRQIAERAKQHEEVNQLQDVMAKQEKIIAELRKTAARKEISLAEKAQAEMALKRAQKIKAAAQKRLMITGSITGGLAGAGSLYQIAKHFLSSGNEGQS